MQLANHTGHTQAGSIAGDPTKRAGTIAMVNSVLPADLL